MEKINLYFFPYFILNRNISAGVLSGNSSILLWGNLTAPK
jgi:hypothetical protein